MTCQVCLLAAAGTAQVVCASSFSRMRACVRVCVAAAPTHPQKKRAGTNKQTGKGHVLCVHTYVVVVVINAPSDLLLFRHHLHHHCCCWKESKRRKERGYHLACFGCFSKRHTLRYARHTTHAHLFYALLLLYSVLYSPPKTSSTPQTPL